MTVMPPPPSRAPPRWCAPSTNCRCWRIATLEPQNCTADVRADGVELYVPTQVQQIAQAAAAKAAGVDVSKVRVHTTFLGGGFGRRLEVDFIPAAVEASRAVKQPVKLLWTREDDMTHDAYRPPNYDQVAAGFDDKGKLVAWNLHLTGPSITARMFPRGGGEERRPVRGRGGS
jgi:isoquinoline 1-oxidoreductase beta subunit